MHFKILGAHCDLICSGLIFRTSLGIKGIIWDLDYQKWDQTPLGHQSTMLSPGLPQCGPWQPGLWCAGQHMPSELPNWPQLDPNKIRPQMKVYLRGVVVQHLHFRAGISEFRAPPVCWHEAGWQWQPSLPISCVHLEPSVWHKDQEKVGQWLPVGSGVVRQGGKVRQALLLVWDWQGQGKSSPAEPGQEAGARVPPPLSCHKCWMDWPACGNADDPQLTAVKMFGHTGKVTQVACWRW